MLLVYAVCALLLAGNHVRTQEFTDNSDHEAGEGEETGVGDLQLRRRTPGYVISLPRTLVEGRNETVCASFHGAAFPVKAIVDLKQKDKHFFTTQVIGSDYSCFELHVPALPHLREPQYVSIRVQMQIDGTVYSSHNQDPILIYPSKQVTFVETDRSVYKPGDHVKFRILTLTSDLLPTVNYKLPEVRVKNPLDVSVDVWENVTTEIGLIQLEYHLPKEAIVGKWKIEANDEVHIFEVSKYVLPRFSVIIISPRIIYFENPWTVFRVCSNYSYGRTVRGNAFIKLTDSHNNMQPIVRLKPLDEGCANFVFKRSQLNLDQLKEKSLVFDPKIHILVTATVTELGTDRIEVATARSLVYLKPYTMRFIADNIFQPGLPYRGKLQLYYVNKDLSNEVIEICYNIAIRRSWNYLNNEQCRNFTVEHGNVIHFQILPLKSNVIHMHLNARSLNHTNAGDSFLVVRLYSPSNSYIHLEQSYAEYTKCKLSQQFVVQYTADDLEDYDNITFYYMVKTRGQLVTLADVSHTVRKHFVNYEEEFQHLIGTAHKFTKTTTAIDKFVLKFRLDERVVSKYQLMVYYVTSNGEVVATSKNIDIEPCLRNKVKANWSRDKLRPGERATLNIKTSSPSLCLISAVDKSVRFLSNYQLLNPNSLLKPFMVEKEPAPSNRKPCLPPVRKRQQASPLQLAEETWDTLHRRRKRYVYSFSEDFDSYDTFNKFGTTTISNLKIITKPCYSGPSVSQQNNAVQFLTDYYDVEPQETVVPIRRRFPETWLWELVPVMNHETVSIHRDLPHTVTNWITNVLCVSNTEGVGFSETTEVAAIQPFFVDVLAPFSVKRGEYLYLNVIIFNYLPHNIPISISLRQSSGLQLVNTPLSRTSTYCIRSNETVNHMLQMIATEIGEMNVTILAEVDTVYPGLCGPDVIVNKRDVVFKKVLIEPEGYPTLVTKSVLLCSSDSSTASNITWELTIPDNIVPDTASASVTLNGDLLGPVVEHLEDLITLPTGCGEQIIASLAPNLYILRYLTATESLTPLVRQRAMRNIKIGYQGILNYIHKDGSFSAFGYHDPMGSMFLTTFVVRTLTDAKSYIYVDQRIIDKAVAWIFEHQLENGCFDSMLHVFQDMGGTTNENSTSSLTAYVIISLTEAGIDIPEKIKTNAKYCIRGDYNPDKYTLAISTYALYIVEWYEEGDRLLKRLLDVASKEQNKLWWTNRDSDNSLATDIETTSYVLLSLMKRNTMENLAHAHSVVRWLTSQRGPHGGFKSTQDTVVALDGLTKYSTLLTSQQLNIDVRVEAAGQFNSIMLQKEDRLKSKKINIKIPDSNVRVSVSGEGCILAQLVQKYYVKNIVASESFKLSMDVQSVSNIDECSIATLSPCLAYNGPDQQANMAVLEVTLPSGYEPDRESLYKLTDEDNSSRVKKFEENENQLIFYFTKINKEQVCINFNIQENIPVSARTDSIIKLYDYYKPEYEVSQFYKMKDKCRFNDSSSVPEISAKAFDGDTDTDSSKDIMHDIIDYPLSDADTEEDSSSSDEPLSESAISDLLNRINHMEHDDNFLRLKRDVINPDFVDMDVEMETPDCGHETKPKFIKTNMTAPKDGIADLRIEPPSTQRQGLNPDFVNMDVDMDIPNGMEANVPMYTAKDRTNNTRSG